MLQAYSKMIQKHLLCIHYKNLSMKSLRILVNSLRLFLNKKSFVYYVNISNFGLVVNSLIYFIMHFSNTSTKMFHDNMKYDLKKSQISTKNREVSGEFPFSPLKPQNTRKPHHINDAAP